MMVSAERGRRLAKRVLERMKEFSGPGCHGLRRLKVGRNVWESIAMMAAEDRRFSAMEDYYLQGLRGLSLHGLPVNLDLEVEADVVYYHG